MWRTAPGGSRSGSASRSKKPPGPKKVPGHGPGTRKKCFALSATTDTSSEEQRIDEPALATIDRSGPPHGVRRHVRLIPEVAEVDAPASARQHCGRTDQRLR